MTRALDWDVTRGRGRPLVGFKQVSDVHVIDEESPSRAEFLDKCDRRLKDAYRVQDSLTTQVGDSMLRALSGFTTGPATEAPLSFTISTGDNIDNNQFNELRWFMGLLDGQTVTPRHFNVKLVQKAPFDLGS